MGVVFTSPRRKEKNAIRTIQASPTVELIFQANNPLFSRAEKVQPSDFVECLCSSFFDEDVTYCNRCCIRFLICSLIPADTNKLLLFYTQPLRFVYLLFNFSVYASLASLHSSSSLRYFERSMPITLSRRRTTPRMASKSTGNIAVIDLTVSEEVKEEAVLEQESESGVLTRSSAFCTYQNSILVESKVNRSTRETLADRLSSD